ncbi:50S ribosomal protein L11 methyltransferase [Sediminicurvatus halobius]|uniref:Ribosomal protein L11 methyltransferase n=1 Tax=Sediminicurvatus halobius TaxID=2182432 RepID=A0A2U2MXQ1_9GAMM|nr:50S ribosomal protein L11 methyltransferase [Spiribacter halobius]PWG61552.1 50S ribosomal protein L11 methyltransferase [Spiribacter halobius]UEX77121.1 50S ribosomal protein L11 methyltransferase [Spiribacter halobius]
MSWKQIVFELPASRAGLAEAVLEAAGALSVTYLEPISGEPVLEPAPGATELWSELRVQALFPAAADAEDIAARLAEGLGARPEGWRVEALADRAWERAWMDDYRPMSFGGGLWVVPTDMSPPEPHAVNLRLDPGLAFGTGTHPTTALCLQGLAARPPAGAHVIDYGCGSGVLAIAALLLGARTAVAVDNDPQALLATRENAERNGVAHRLTVLEADAALPATDCLLANILAGVLEALAGRLAGALRPGGRLMLSGILAEQAASVARAYAPACGMAAPVTRSGWVRLDGVRRGEGA